MKTKSLFTALLFALVVSSCQDPEKITPTFGDSDDDTTTEDVNGLITLQASTGSASSKVGFEESTSGDNGYKISLTWESDDSFTLYDSDSEEVCEFKYSGTEGENSGQFTQTEAVSLTNGTIYTARIGSTDLTATQVVSDVESLDHLNSTVRMSAELTYSIDGDNAITFEHEVALIRLAITMEEGTIPASVTLEDGEGGSTYTLSLPAELTASSVTTYMAVEANDNESRTLTFTVTDSQGTGHEYAKEITAQFEAGYLYNAPIDFTEGDGDDDGSDDDGSTTITDYYKQGYTAANGVTYSENTSGVQLLTETTEIEANGVYFLAPANSDVTFTIKSMTFTNLVIIGRYPGGKNAITASGLMTFGAGDAVIFKNITFNPRSEGYGIGFTTSTDYLGTLNYWIVDDCKVVTASDQHLSYFNSTSGSIVNTIFTNNSIDVQRSSNATSTGIAYFNAVGTESMENITMENNIIYAGTSGRYIYGPAIFVNSTNDTTNINISFKNNSLVNYLGASANSVIAVPNANSIAVNKNIFWNGSQSVHSAIVRYTVATSAPSSEDLSDNIYYGLGDSYSYYLYGTSSTYKGADDNTALTKESESPFSNWSVTTGTFTQKDAYADYGAVL